MHPSWDSLHHMLSLLTSLQTVGLGLSCLEFAVICSDSWNQSLHRTHIVCCMGEVSDGNWRGTERRGGRKSVEQVGHIYSFLYNASVWEATAKEP